MKLFQAFLCLAYSFRRAVIKPRRNIEAAASRDDAAHLPVCSYVCYTPYVGMARY